MVTRNFIPVNGDTLETNGGLFIIPNGLMLAPNFLPYMQDSVIGQMKAICELNGMTFDPENDFIAECWPTSSSFICGEKYNWDNDNLADHPSFVHFNGQDIMVSFANTRLFPVKVLEKFKEGEITDIWIPAQMSTSDKVCHAYLDPDCVTTACLLHLEACQLKTRYPHHGNFQECLEYLKSKADHTIRRREK